MSQLQEQVAEAKTLITQLIGKVKSLNEEKANLNKEIENLKGQLSEIEKNGGGVSVAGHLIESAYNTKNAVEILSRRYNDLFVEHNRAENAIAKLARIHKECLDEINDLKGQLNDKGNELSRKDEMLKSAVSVRRELEEKNRELLEKLNRISSQSKGDDIHDGIKVIAKPYKFGKTTEVIIDKVKRFVDGMFDGAKIYNLNGVDETLLNNPASVGNFLGLTDKEISVFMERLQNIRYNDVPLFVIDENGNLSTVFGCDWIKKYISTLVD